jgi:hypothetical protein
MAATAKVGSCAARQAVAAAQPVAWGPPGQGLVGRAPVRAAALAARAPLEAAPGGLPGPGAPSTRCGGGRGHAVGRHRRHAGGLALGRPWQGPRGRGPLDVAAARGPAPKRRPAPAAQEQAARAGRPPGPPMVMLLMAWQVQGPAGGGVGARLARAGAARRPRSEGFGAAIKSRAASPRARLPAPGRSCAIGSGRIQAAPRPQRGPWSLYRSRQLRAGARPRADRRPQMPALSARP